MVLLHSTRLYITLPWLYLTLLDSTLLYHGSTSLYWTLHYCTMALLHSTRLYTGEVGHKKSNLGAGQWKLACSFVMTHNSWSQPDPRAKCNSIAEKTGFSVLNWRTNVINARLITFPSQLSPLNWSFLLSCWVLAGDRAGISFCIL